MTPETVIAVVQDGMQMLMLVSAPLLLSALVTGLLVSIFQAATQINEMTLTFIPKLLVMFITIILAGPWMLATMVDYTRRLIESIPGMIG